MGRADGLASTELPTAGCLAIDELLELVQGDVAPARRDLALAHVDGCRDCQVLLAEAGAAMQSSNAHPVPRRRGVFGVGDRISNRYDVERFIAKGGMGEVYAVFDSLLGERVALKTVAGAAPNDSKAIRRLKSEVLLSRRIGHPNTCRIYEFGEHQLDEQDVVCYFTMALVNGETLGARVRREGALAPPEVAIVSRQILAGLAEAHGLGILHRDLKSDNIMLRSPPTPGLSIDAVIMDFGLALRLDGNERFTSDSNAIVGSFAYMAPEQVASERLTSATDIYAFGVILFEMLTGRLPFRGASPAAVALQRLRQVPPAPSSVDPRLDPAWDRIVLGCLERSADKRFASARDVLATIDAIKGPAPARAPRRWRRVVLVAVGVLACSVLVVWGRAALRTVSTAAKESPALTSRSGIDTATSALSADPAALAPVAPVPVPPASGVVPVADPAPPAPGAPIDDRPSVPPLRTKKSAVPPAPSRTPTEAAPRPSQEPAVAPAAVPREPSAPVAPGATRQPGAVDPASPQRRQPVGPLPVDPEFPE